jgi:cobalt/nickel transport protein
MSLSRLSFVLFCALPLGPVLGHEYWLSPQSYQVESGENIAVDFRNGEEFVGSVYSYLPNRVSRFEVIVDGVAQPVEARAGDTPALAVPAPAQDALLVAIMEASPLTVTYKDWNKFLSFTNHKDFPHAEADHIANGWPQDRFKERYTRHAKTLIAVGNGEGQDAPIGMATEFVALTNPYAEGFDGQMKVALRYQDAPRPDAQIEVFERGPEGDVTITMHRTDAAGEAVIPVSDGHEYLFDAVVLRPVEGVGTGKDIDANQPVWETLWAALTFSVPQ